MGGLVDAADGEVPINLSHEAICVGGLVDAAIGEFPIGLSDETICVGGLVDSADGEIPIDLSHETNTLGTVDAADGGVPVNLANGPSSSSCSVYSGVGLTSSVTMVRIATTPGWGSRDNETGDCINAAEAA